MCKYKDGYHEPIVIYVNLMCDLPAIREDGQQFISVDGPVFSFTDEMSYIGKGHFPSYYSYTFLSIRFKQHPLSVVFLWKPALRTWRYNKICNKHLNYNIIHVNTRNMNLLAELCVQQDDYSCSSRRTMGEVAQLYMQLQECIQ